MSEHDQRVRHKARQRFTDANWRPATVQRGPNLGPPPLRDRPGRPSRSNGPSVRLTQRIMRERT